MKKSVLGIVAIVVMMAVVMAGCPNPTTDDDPVFSGVLYEDGFSPKLADPKYWNVDETATTDEEGARGFVTGAEKTIVKNGTESFKVDWSAATDWMGLALNVGSGPTISGTVNLSGFTALTFWAKADGTDAEINGFGFGADDSKLFTNGEKYKTSIENVTVPAADWKKFIIPLPNPAKLDMINSLFYAVDGASGGTIYLDDIKFEKLSNVAVKTFGYSGTALNVEAAGTANIGDLSAVFTDGTDDISLTFENLAAHVSWESDKSAVATVNDEGQITGVATGTATITGTLGGETVTISVTVAQAVPFTGVLFDDAPQGGFALNKDAGGGADKVTIDPAASVDSQTAIKVTLASDAGDWGGFFFERSSGVDISGKTLEFSVLKASLDTAPITKFGVKLQDTLGVHPAQTHHSEIDLFTSSFTKTDNGNWYDFSIPVAAFNSNDFDATDFNILGFWNPKKDDSGSEVLATGEFVFDDIKFVETTATTYTVTYNANGADGGTLSKVTDTVNDGHTVLAAPTGITRTDHTFSGWNTASDGSGTDFDFGTTPVIGDITLYAQWTAVTPFDRTIFDDALQGGFTASINASTGEVAAVTDESTVISGTSGKSVKFELNSASTWGGGYLQNVAGVDASSYTSLSFDINLSQLDSTVDFLQFKLEDTAGGATADALNLYDLAETATTGDWKSYTVYLANYNIIDFSKFKAIGFWHPKAGATYTPGTFYVDNVEFGTATATPHTVTYNANPGSETLVGNLSKTSEQVNSGSTIASAPDGFSITGYTLKGWNTASDGSGTDFVFGTTPVNGDITLYAQWEMVVAFTGILFDDALQNGFAVDVNSDGDAAIDATEATTVVGTSGASIKISQSSGNWGGGFVQNTNGVDASSYAKIQFSINVASLDSGVDYLEVKLEDVPAAAYSVNLYDLTADDTDGDWNTYSIALSAAAGMDLTQFKSIGFWHPRAGGVNGTFTPGTFYVDDIKFNNEAVAQHTVTYHANPGTKTLVGSLSKTSDTVNSGSTIASAPGGISIADHVLRDWNNQPDGSGHSFVFGLNSITDDMDLYAQWVVDKLDERYYFLGDATGVGTPEMEGSGMTHFGGYDNTITFTTEASGGADSTSGYFKLVGTGTQGWAAGGWGDGPYIDFTGYDTLVFWAKVPDTPTVGKIAATQVKFVLTSRHRTSGGDVGGPIITRPEGSNFTTTWTKYEIPLTEITSDTNFMQEAIKEFKYDFLGNNHELHLDEVYLRRASGNAPALAVTVPEDSSKAIDENPAVDTVLENIAKLTTVTAGATLSYSITDQSAAGAMSIDPDTGVLKVADATPFVYVTNQQLTATVEVSADDGGTPVTDSITVTINIKNPAVAPTDAPTAPTTAAADVINLFSDTYAGTAATQINVTEWNPGWNQATVYSEVTIAGNTVKKYSNLNYQGIEFTNEDVSTKTKVHFDLWTADETSFTFFLITPGPHEHGVAKTPTLNSWNSYDIDLSDYTTGNASLNLADIFQIKIVGSGGKTVFLDNIYFY